MAKLGFFGGTFDPVHLGHMLLAETAYRQFGLDKLFFMPNYRSPFKAGKDVSDVNYRLDMLKEAIRDIPYMDICHVEINNKELSYTADTVLKLRKTYPDDEIYFIIGEDSLITFPTWYHPERILENAVLLVAGRIIEGDPVGNIGEHIDAILDKYEGRIDVLRMPFLDISSSLIRERIKEGSSIRFLVPEGVRKFIEEKGIYK